MLQIALFFRQKQKNQ